MGKISRIFVLLGILSLGLSACSTDSDFSLDKRYLSFGRVEARNGDIDNGFDIRLDDGSWLVINNSPALTKKLDDGDRVQLIYTLLGELEPLDGDKRFIAVLNYYYRILSKKPVTLSFIEKDFEHRQDSIGNDPIRVAARGFGGRYLNIRFAVARQVNTNELHFINLVADDTHIEEGIMDVYLRHNGYKDVPTTGSGRFVYTESIVSFDILGLIPQGEKGIRLRLNWTEYEDNTGWGRTVERSQNLGTFMPYGITDNAYTGDLDLGSNESNIK